MTGALADALDGVRVLDLSRLLPGPFLTMILADLGADVVKVEDPKLGDYMRNFPPAKGGMSGRYLAVNRGKRSIVLDLKAPAGRNALLRMAARADVVVESFRPGVLDKLGVGYAALAAANPGIIVCSISGFGQTGPYVDRAGHDVGYQALAGVLAMGGEAGGAPWMPGVQLADLAGGALWSATAILAALVGRHRTGRGAHLDISMTEGALALATAELGNLACGHAPTRGVEALNGGLAC
ncbi:MAG TPA: CoA transferase, partial [Kofleriaceae bacterium]